jgi:hypothetical protein
VVLMSEWPSKLVIVEVRGPGLAARRPGWAVGEKGVLATHHAVAEYLADPYDEHLNPRGVRCQAVTAGTSGVDPFDCAVLWCDEERDLALLQVIDGTRHDWRERLGDQPLTVASGSEGVWGNRVSVVGFPDAMVNEARGSDLHEVEGILQGTLLRRTGSRALITLDESGSLPSNSMIWQGMSGAAVRLKDGDQSLVGIVSHRRPDRAGRHLFASLLPEPQAAQPWSEALEKVGAHFARRQPTPRQDNSKTVLTETDPGTHQARYEEAARVGDTDAMLSLGFLLAHSDADAARTWIAKAAQKGHPRAMTIVALMRLDDDPHEARSLLEQAAQKGHGDAVTHLMLHFEDVDPDAARNWYERAAQRGDRDAMFNLGVMLSDSDPAAAAAWRDQARDVRRSH